MTSTANAPIIYIIEPYGGSIRRHNPNLPLLFADDAGVTRGDGIFESLVVRGGKAHNLQRHVERFRTSAAAMDLPAPQDAKWEEATLVALEEFGEGEGKCTWTYTRGRASTGIPSAWVTIEPVDAMTLKEREKGVKVKTMLRTWSLPTEIAAKTVNYAATMASLRAAKQDGCDDVIFVDAEGRVLEGSRSTVITTKGQKLRTPQAPGIIPGTTQKAIFELAQERGYRCKEKVMDLDYLRGADSIWLVSSARGPVRVTALNGDKLPKPANEAELKELMTEAMFS
ncbi:aminodeoxychorismate lyase [uncultured Corynebacterium sp.]|uniref:aminodeoxychorismate lyase n=1 Tax=uncultured Corynebacterium sp. TaxID=159447 RepID=UPI0025F5828A|nr:aminodeoxychorismate lyase [uncultured Corynebacterium sp.]